MRRRYVAAIFVLALAAASLARQQAAAQSFGVELHATMTPASGGMGGASIAKPQDVQSPFTGNFATLTQFKGTQFGFGGGWAEPTINVDNDATLPLANVGPFDAKSEQPGSFIGNIAVTQDYTALGLPITMGMGLITGAGLGVKYTDELASNGSAASLSALHTATGVGVQMTERLSVGAGAYVTYGVLDGPFSGLTSATTAYGLRGMLGASYDATDYTTLGCYWMTKESFNFEDAVRLSIGGGAFAAVSDIDMDLPETFGWGVANDRLMDGRLLLATDILWKRYSHADLFRAIWDDQFVVQTGLQYAVNDRLRLRAGYTFAENNMRDLPGAVAGGVVPPDGLPAMQYLQSQFPSVTPHRLTGGVGVRDVLPGIDFDAHAGGMFFGQDQFGLTGVDAESYWIGFGFTWRFGRGACDCEARATPNQW